MKKCLLAALVILYALFPIDVAAKDPDLAQRGSFGLGHFDSPNDVATGAAVFPVSGRPMPESMLRLKPGTTLRVQTVALTKLEGQLLRTSSDTLFLAGQASETAVSLNDLNAVWRRGAATKTGAVVGGIVGGIGGGVLASFIYSMSDDPAASGSAGTGTAIGAILGAAGGAVVGGVIGYGFFTKWHRCFP